MNFLEAMKFRHACKIFDESKKIGKADFDFILEAGRMSPSSMGLEQWDFVVVQNPQIREKIREKCWNQAQITSCSHLVIILAKVGDFKSGSDYVREIVERKTGGDPEATAAKIEFCKNLIKSRFNDDDERIFDWSHGQCLLAALNMMNAAASIGIDSCPIEGFERDEVGKILGLDFKKQRVAIAVPFGYRLNPQPPKTRREISEIVKWIE